MAHLKAAGLPLVDEIVYTSETDLNKLMGRPNQYTAKASWRDARVAREGAADVRTGGTAEIFANEADRIRRQEYVGALAKSPPFVEYAYAKGRVLVRVAKELTPDQAAEYERALASFPEQ